MTSLKEALEKYYIKSITNINQFSEDYIKEFEENMNRWRLSLDFRELHGAEITITEATRYLRGEI